jgi:hypothetical protein
MLASRMARRKKPRLKVAKEARRRARLGIGLPPAERTIPNKREKPEKHKKTLGELLREE